MDEKLKSIIDELFSRAISGTYIEPRNIEHFDNVINKLAKHIREVARQAGDEASIKRMKKLQDAVQKAFERMEEELDKRINDNSSGR